ncbi:histidine-rich glycoprotein [Phascolarctos cinereus]|uniref:Histidine-rich glycoprotein n=1 Tax=Phascolarctos cinereus TaxID=38626 RepID=A0A6P5KG83_PHACI|nr:histidine-rich glycoprotein [Phascolarctos cinereus]
MWALTVLLLLLASAELSSSVSPADCEAVGLKAGEILNQINEKRRDGYQFQLLRVADAHTDAPEEESAVIHYLVLDVKESDCSVLSRTPVENCQPKGGKRPTDTVIGKCKVVAISHPNTTYYPEHDKVIEFNCTTSSVSSALTNPTSETVIIDYFENPEQYKEQAEKALKRYQEANASVSSFQLLKVERALEERGGESTTLYLDFSIRNHSEEAPPPPPPPPHHFSGPEGRPPPPHFFRSCPVFGFCWAALVYDVKNSDLNKPDDLHVNCEIFKEDPNFSSGRHHRFGGHGHHPPRGPPPSHGHVGHGSRKPPHPDHSHEHRGPPPTHPPSLEEKEPKAGPQKSSDNSPVRDEPDLHHPEGTHPSFAHADHHRSDPHKPCPLGPGPHKYGSQGHGRHGHGPHGHGRHGHHRHGPHGHGPCGHGPPPGHTEQDVHRLPPLKNGEVLPLPEISIPGQGPCPEKQHPPKPEIQPFPQTSSESCPGSLKFESPQLLPFLEHKI